MDPHAAEHFGFKYRLVLKSYPAKLDLPKYWLVLESYSTHSGHTLRDGNVMKLADLTSEM